jgi:hypothetical protein
MFFIPRRIFYLMFLWIIFSLCSQDSCTPSNIWQPTLFEPSKQAHVNSPVTLEPPVSPPDPPVATAAPVPTVVTGAEKKALVLYRPLNPPLYPGGPSPTGSSEFPIKVNAAGYLATIRGTENNGFCSSAGLPSSAFTNSSANALCRAGLFEALDLQGGPSSALSSRRLQRVSSCSSLPPIVTSLDNFAMEDDSDPQTSSVSQMVVIPAVPTPSTKNLSPVVSGMMTTHMNKSVAQLGDEEEMADIEPMEVMEDIANGEVVSSQAGPQFGSPIPTFGSSQWKTGEMLKAPYSKVMWSH